MNAPPDAVAMPRLPPVAPRVAPAPPAAPQPVAPAAAPATQAVPTQSKGPRRSGRRVLITTICSLVALGLFGIGVYGTYLIATVAKEVDGDRELPAFSVAPPAYGTVRVLVDQFGAEAQKYQVVANADASVRFLTWTPDSFVDAGALVAMDPNGLYLLPAGESTWVLVDRSPVDLLGSEEFTAKVLTFADCVPEAARRYTTVTRHSEVTVGARGLQRYELRIAVGRWNSDMPSSFAAWDLSGDTVPSRDEVMDFTVYVDQSGVVWQLEIGENADLMTVKLESFAPEAFAPQMPLVYYDSVNRVLVGA